MHFQNNLSVSTDWFPPNLISLYLLIFHHSFITHMTEMQDPKQMSKFNTTTKDRNTKPYQLNNMKMEKHLVFNKSKTFEHLTSNENKTKLTGKAPQRSDDAVALMLNATYAKPEEKATMKAKTQNNKLIEMLSSSPNETKEKSKSDPDWNKNDILGYNKKHEIDYSSIKNINGPFKNESLGNASKSKLQEILNENISASTQALNEIGIKR